MQYCLVRYVGLVSSGQVSGLLETHPQIQRRSTKIQHQTSSKVQASLLSIVVRICFGLILSPTDVPAFTPHANVVFHP